MAALPVVEDLDELEDGIPRGSAVEEDDVRAEDYFMFGHTLPDVDRHLLLATTRHVNLGMITVQMRPRFSEPFVDFSAHSDQRTFSKCDPFGEEVNHSDSTYISPLMRAHVIPTGTYYFARAAETRTLP